MEVWKSIKDYPNYEISNLGRVKSLQRFVNHYHGGKALKKEKILNPNKCIFGYYSVTLFDGYKYKMYKIHRLVGINFILNSLNKKEINHINGIKTDNRLENLEWCTRSENTIHSYKTGLQKINKKVSENQLIEIKKILNKDILQKDIALKFNLSQTIISKIKLGIY